MNKSWDKDKGGRTAWIAWMTEVAAECLRLLKPGGHALVWALPRTSHWTATAWEDAGFELRDKLFHLFGSGFPKSANVSKLIDKAAGAEREVIGPNKFAGNNGKANLNTYGIASRPDETAPATDAARQWDGWGTALKPAVEEWLLLRKPLSEKNIAANVLAWGTGGINVDACRIGTSEDDLSAMDRHKNPTRTGWAYNGSVDAAYTPSPQGRWPANLILDEEAAALLDEQSGVLQSNSGNLTFSNRKQGVAYGKYNPAPTSGISDTGGASRFFYCAKASKRDRDEGLEGMPEREAHKLSGGEYIAEGRTAVKGKAMARNFHPTVKPTALMSWLVRLVTPPGGTVLDPFCGSGSTGKAAVLEGFSFIGIDKEAEYLTIAAARIEHASSQVEAQLQMPLLELA